MIDSQVLMHTLKILEMRCKRELLGYLCAHFEWKVRHSQSTEIYGKSCIIWPKWTVKPQLLFAYWNVNKSVRAVLSWDFDAFEFIFDCRRIWKGCVNLQLNCSQNISSFLAFFGSFSYQRWSIMVIFESFELSQVHFSTALGKM